MDPGFGDLGGGIDDPIDGLGLGPDLDLGIEMEPNLPGEDIGLQHESVGFGGIDAALDGGVDFGGFDMDIDQPGMLAL